MLTKINNLVKHNFIVPIEKNRYRHYQSRYAQDYSFTEAVANYQDVNTLYAYLHHYFHHLSSPKLQEHRIYFNQNKLGFGEDAFHAMWFLLLREFKPLKCLEIGIYKGQVISLWNLIGQILGLTLDVHGISPFTSIGDEVSQYSQEADYFNDTLNSFKKFNLPLPTLIKALSTEDIAIKHIAEHSWDLIYIDGSHDYEIVIKDYQLCKNNLKYGGLLVMDDSSLNTLFQPPAFSFPGHPGPSKVVTDFAMKQMQHLATVGHNNIFIKI